MLRDPEASQKVLRRIFSNGRAEKPPPSLPPPPSNAGNWIRANEFDALSGVGVIDEVLQRVLLETAVQLVSDDALLAALAAVVRREQFEQVGTAAGQNDAVGRNFPRSNLH